MEGAAVDPIELEPVDEVVVTMLMDNSYDGLLGATGPADRRGLFATPTSPSSVMVDGETRPGLVAEHGFSALVTVRRADRTHTLLFDTGISPNGMADNMERLGIAATDIEAVVLSHGHFDHAGGLEGLAGLRRRAGLPIVVHPLVWSRRRVADPGDARGRTADGVEAVARGGGLRGHRTTSAFVGARRLRARHRRGRPDHRLRDRVPVPRAPHDDAWEPDPLILDDQALVVNVRGQGLLVLTGCGHAGAVNIARHAMRLTGVDRLHALLGGFHLGGPAFERIIEPTVSALTEMEPSVIVPAHCTGWKAQHRFAAALPDAFIPNAVGTSYTISAAV